MIIVDCLSLLRVTPTRFNMNLVGYLWVILWKSRNSGFSTQIPLIFSFLYVRLSLLPFLSFSSFFNFYSYHELSLDWHLKVLSGLWFSLSIIVMYLRRIWFLLKVGPVSHYSVIVFFALFSHVCHNDAS